jgi:peptidoglycan lytic transglycosylase A
MAARRARSAIFVVVLLLIAGAGVFWIWRSQQVPSAGRLVLVRARFSDLPGWRMTDPRPAYAAFRRSCAEIEKMPAATAMGGVGYAGRVGDWQGVCAALPPALSSARSAREFFESRFTPVLVMAGNTAQGLFTGYYEPQILASRTRHGAFQTPIYGLPDDLIGVDLGAFKPELAGQHIEGRIVGHRLVPYPTRAQIDADGLATAPVLLYARDPVNVFFLHIQGSGRVKLEDGSTLRIAYAGQNGRPYTPIGRVLIEDGGIDSADMSMQAIRAWLKAHPKGARDMMEQDRSFVFFKEEPIGDPSLGAAGSEGVPLTPGASLAVDAHLHPLGAPVYIAAADTSPQALRRLLIAQDTGGAIRGPVRGDVFWGFGPKAEDTAGRMTARGRMFVFLPKAVAASLGARRQYGLDK